MLLHWALIISEKNCVISPGFNEEDGTFIVDSKLCWYLLTDRAATFTFNMRPVA